MKMSMGDGSAKRDKKRERALAHITHVPAGTPATPVERGFSECPCPKTCTLHGECLPCVAYHLQKHSMPRCQR